MILEKCFEELGIDERAQRVYLALAEVGKANASLLSKSTGIPRATVYAVLSDLINKGLVSQEQLRGSTLYLTNGPAAFTRMVEREKELLVSKEKTAKDLIELLSPYLKSTNYSIPKLQFFEGKQNIEAMLYEYLPEWRKSYLHSEDPTLWGYQDPSIVEAYKKWHDYLWHTSSATEKICLFTTPTDFEKGLKNKVPGRSVRFLPAGVKIDSSIWIYGDYIVMCMTRQKPHYAFQMRDTVFSANLRSIFKLLWSATF